MAIQRLTDAHSTFERFFNAGDVDGLANLYEAGAKLVLPEGEVVGHDAIREALGKLLHLRGTMRMELVGVVEIAGMAVTSGTWHLEGENGQTILRGESIEVFRRGPDGWLAVIDCPFGVG